MSQTKQPIILSNRKAGPDEPSTRLVHARAAAGYATMEAAAKAMGVPTSTYSQHECGMRGLKFAAENYAKHFNVTKEWLLWGDAGAPPPRKRVEAPSSDVGYPAGLTPADLQGDTGHIGPGGDVSVWVEHLPTGELDSTAMCFPEAFLERLGLTVQSAALLEVNAETATADLREGDTVLLDTDDTDPDRPGVFALRSTAGQLAVRKLEALVGTDPPEVRIAVGGTDPHAYNVRRKGLHVLGRVRWVGRVI